MGEIKLMFTISIGKRRHKSIFAITDDRRVVSDCFLLVKITGYVVPVSVNRNIKD
mgnify:CR=1 FL=1